MLLRMQTPERLQKRLWLSLVAGFLLLAAYPAFGCNWDSDTLANEAKGLPDVVQVITGRFERNPPLYYAMRLKRVTAELAAHPENLADYDDAGVACGRLAHDDEAIAWMQQKRVWLEKADKNAPVTKEHWYRYYANIGTFRVHRWLRAGADRTHLSEVQQARDEIAKAIEINPNAHFGREKVQLAFIDWLITPEAHKSTPGRELADLIPGFNREATTKGLCGLIVLGNAWESVDAYLMLTDNPLIRQQTVQYLAALRCKELLDQGRHSLLQEWLPDDKVVKMIHSGRFTLDGGVAGEIREQYQQLRAEADAWQQRRTEYMMARLQSGRHPDTDPNFWSEWKETPPPSLAVPWYRYYAARIWAPNYIAEHIGSYFCALVVLVIGLRILKAMFVVWRRRKSKSV